MELCALGIDGISAIQLINRLEKMKQVEFPVRIPDEKKTQQFLERIESYKMCGRTQ